MERTDSVENIEEIVVNHPARSFLDISAALDRREGFLHPTSELQLIFSVTFRFQSRRMVINTVCEMQQWAIVRKSRLQREFKSVSFVQKF
jgi:hypothetical protein